MDKAHYEEMVKAIDGLIAHYLLQDRKIYVFGHCNATEELADLLMKKNFTVKAILDNNTAKHGSSYRGIPITPPETILSEDATHTIVCIVARAYAAMNAQLRELGFSGNVVKLVNYNSYAEYSLSGDTMLRMWQRVERGIRLKEEMEQKYPGAFKVLCPFCALGDVFLTMSYLPYFAGKRWIDGKDIVYCVIGSACRQVVSLFGADKRVECFSQKDMDELVQACLYTEDETSFIAHQDRPYMVNLHKALYLKCIPLEIIYRCGVFGLPIGTEPVKPENLQVYPGLEQIKKGNAVVFSPYAKSVTSLPKDVWSAIVSDYKAKGYQCFTNVAGEEKPLTGTTGISPTLSQVQSLVEWAGTFVGIRSGLCDVLKYAACDKTALFPDYHYCDTKWKAIDMYAIDGWRNLVVKDGFLWGKS